MAPETRSERLPTRKDNVARSEYVFPEKTRNSMRMSGLELGVLGLTVIHGVHERLRMFSYKMSFLQPHISRNNLPRLGYIPTTRSKLSIDSGYLERTVLSDDCSFHSNEVVNMQKAKVWGVGNHRLPTEYQKRQKWL